MSRERTGMERTSYTRRATRRQTSESRAASEHQEVHAKVVPSQEQLDRDNRNRALGTIIAQGRERFREAQEAGEKMPKSYLTSHIYGEDALAARDELVESNFGIAVNIALEFQYRGIEFEDLRQEATFALIKAANRYNPESAPFSTFAEITIKGELKRVVSRTSELVHFPRALLEKRPLVMSTQIEMERRDSVSPSGAALATEVAKKLLEEELKRPPTEEEIKEKTEELIPDIHYMRTKGHVGSLSVPLGEEGLELSEILPDPEDDFEELIHNRALREIISDRLTPREQRAVYLRYWQDKTQGRIAEEDLHMSQMNVSRILAEARRKIGEALEEE